MEVNEILRTQIFEIIQNQLKDNDPPETKQTYDRLRSQGLDDFTTNQLLGQCVLLELFDIIKHNKSFNEERYKSNLLALPEKPQE